jgi:hypothetical protein
MIPPDQDIFEVEQRIASRRGQLARHSREASKRAMQALASPAALIGAALLGFLVAGAMAKREQKPKHPERRKSDHTKAAKATGLAGILLPVAMWVVRAQWGSPVNVATALLQKFQQRKAKASPPADTRRDAARMSHP